MTSQDPMQAFIAQLAADNGKTVEEFKATGLPPNVPLLQSARARELYDQLDEKTKERLLFIRPDTIISLL